MAVVLLCLLSVVSVHTRYSEYSGAKMPEYSESFDDLTRDHDYKEKAVDSPLLLDYKFEDEPSDESSKRVNVDNEQDDSWQEQPLRKLRRPPQRSHTDVEKDLDTLNVDDSSRFKANSKKFKSKDYDADDDIGLSRIGKFKRRKKDFKFRESESYDIHGKNEMRRYDRTTERYIRRKIRDRFTTPENYGDEYNDKIPFNKFNKHQFDKPSSFNKISRSEDRMKDGNRDEDNYTPAVRSPIRSKYPNDYKEYHDNYDMIRVQSIKDKLPLLIRRSKAVDTSVVTTSSNELEHESMLLLTKLQSPPDTTISFKIIATDANVDDELEQFITTTQNVTSTKELSMAEKSRLSILKKSQKKEQSKVIQTKKPPVLLQVTLKSVHTVVMLEPHEDYPKEKLKAKDVQRAIEVFNDSPETLLTVKKMMRQKLVKNAKNMNELIDNWDDMVCDYIDTGVLKSSKPCLVKSNYMLINIVVIVLCTF